MVSETFANFYVYAERIATPIFFFFFFSPISSINWQSFFPRLFIMLQVEVWGPKIGLVSLDKPENSRW